MKYKHQFRSQTIHIYFLVQFSLNQKAKILTRKDEET